VKETPAREALLWVCELIEGMPSEALTPLTPLSQGERGEQNQEKDTLTVVSQSFSLLSLWERRAGVVRALGQGGLIALCLFLLAVPAHAEEIRGRVQLLARGGKGPARGSDVRQAVVYYEPAGPPAARPAQEPFEMVTRRKELVPRLLVIPRGSRVRFPNQDPILHNVFSVSSPNDFDLGLYRRGPGKEKRFGEPGLVRVFCNVHHDMVAYILVLDTPYHVSPDPGGEFVLTGLPRGKGKLTVWHEQADPWTVDVELPQKTHGPLMARVQIVRPLIPAHLNKLGQSYFRSQRDRYDNR
jgi:plastocyanin